MKYILSYSLIACMALFYSCSSSNNNSGENTIIDVESVVGKGAIHKASDYIKQIKYIPLETTQNSMVGNISNIIVNNNKIYVRDDKSVITIFDLNGKYLNTLNRVGRGPEEYMNIVDFEVTPSGNILVASRQEGLVEYGADLRFLRKISPEGGVDAGLNDLIILKDGLFASNTFVLDMQAGSAKQAWKIYDDSLKTLFSYSADPEVQSSPGGSGGTGTIRVGIRLNIYSYYIYNKNLNLFRAGNDTIFNINYENDYQKSARYVVNCGKYQYLEDMESGINLSASGPSGQTELKAISLSSMIETDNYLFMSFNFRGLAPEPFEVEPFVSSSAGREMRIGGGKSSTVNGIYDKKSGKLSLLNQPIPKTLGLRNDINNGAIFWPRSITEKQELISWYNALDLVMLAEEGKIDKSVIGNLKEDDNPVVAIAVPK